MERLPEFPPGSLGTCAIIGNADNLLRHKWGPEIDQHDFVVRFNVKMKVWCSCQERRDISGLIPTALHWLQLELEAQEVAF